MSKLYAIANDKSRFVVDTKVLVSIIFRVKEGTNWYYAFDYDKKYPSKSQSTFPYNSIIGRDLFPNIVCAYVGDTDIDTRGVRFFYAPVEHFESELMISE